MNMPANPADFNGIEIVQRDGALMASSREVAHNFGKMHKDVLRAIRNLECSEDFNRRNFAPVEYLDAKGEKRTEYGMTRDGFSFLVMGFTGREAAVWKEKYIAAFNAMEGRLRAERQAATIDLNDPSQLVPLLTSYAQRTQVAEARVVALAPKAEAFDRLDAIEGALSVRPAAKVLGVAEHKLIRWLQLNRWAFRQNGQGPLQAYVDKRNCGYLDHKLGEYTGKDGDQRVSITLMITPKGMARLAQIFNREGML
ncbi:Rha family transcriptional regulator, partial [Pseudogemmobacter sonorensis]|uniref:Rha family transcriptional regulator n=1 Tax=Pseudogemmobacter sonorensis TaxID=2989681 RepID=UPI00369B7E87